MATIPVLETGFTDGTTLWAWEDVTESDTGGACAPGRFPDKTVQVSGDFTTGGTVVIEGSNDGVTYATLHSPDGVALSFTAAGIAVISENPRYIRPRATAGSAVAMDVALFGAPR